MRRIDAASGTAVAVSCDVGRPDDVDAAVQTAVDAYGRLDVMFNNAGIASPRRGILLEEHTDADFDRLVDVNARGVFNGCRTAVRQFKVQGDGGVVVNTGSVAGMVSWGSAVYGGTKALVIQLTRALAIEGAPFGIRANCICPGGMFTNFGVGEGEPVFRERTAEELEMAKTLHPLGKPITPRGLRGGGALPRVRPGGERHRGRAPDRRRVPRGARVKRSDRWLTSPAQRALEGGHVLFLHDVHAAIGEHEIELDEAVRDVYAPTIADDDARLAWYLYSTHGAGDAYIVNVVTALRDGAAWERLSRRLRYGDLADWLLRSTGSRTGARARLLVSTEWSPTSDLDLDALPVGTRGPRGARLPRGHAHRSGHRSRDFGAEGR